MKDNSWINLDARMFRDRWYREMYSTSSYSGVAGLGHRLMHRSLEKGIKQDSHYGTVLEIGGNVGEHLPFVKHSFSRYIVSDIENRLSDDDKGYLDSRGAEFCLVNAEKINLGDETIDRVLNACLFHHLSNPEAAFIEMRRVMKVGGRADIYVGSDPGALFRLARLLGPGMSCRVSGYGDEKSLMDARDHLGNAWSIHRLLSHVFRNDSVQKQSWPFPKASIDTSLWTVFRVTKKK